MKRLLISTAMALAFGVGATAAVADPPRVVGDTGTIVGGGGNDGRTTQSDSFSDDGVAVTRGNTIGVNGVATTLTSNGVPFPGIVLGSGAANAIHGNDAEGTGVVNNHPGP